MKKNLPGLEIPEDLLNRIIVHAHQEYSLKMALKYLTGRKFWWETGVQGIRAKQEEILSTMIFYISLLDCIDSSMEF